MVALTVPQETREVIADYPRWVAMACQFLKFAFWVVAEAEGKVL